MRSPADGAAVRKPPRLLWDRVSRASFYNVQVYYGSKKILSTWPRRALVQLGARWSYAGYRFGLRKGVYHWYVWPAFGAKAHVRYGKLLGASTFTVGSA